MSLLIPNSRLTGFCSMWWRTFVSSAVAAFCCCVSPPLLPCVIRRQPFALHDKGALRCMHVQNQNSISGLCRYICCTSQMTKLVGRQEVGSALGLNACLFFLDAGLSQLMGIPVYAAHGGCRQTTLLLCWGFERSLSHSQPLLS